ncbi:MAG: DUF1611 domain-containing protein [Pseudomonadota bacterium]
MLQPHHKLAIYMQDGLDNDYGKMGFGVMRYSNNEVSCVVDRNYAGKVVSDACELPFPYPVVGTVDEAVALGANVLILGTAPSGGRVPDDWMQPIEQAIKNEMCLVNGLHDRLNDSFGHLLQGSDQWIWDVRQPAFTPAIATAMARELDNKRILMVGTDMAIGKMTAGLEVYKNIRDRGLSTRFLATGQIGITVTGEGIPLDAFKVDHACGAVETMVMGAKDADYVFVEGQGSLVHPGSSATLSLMRGSCATHLIMCHRAGQSHLRKPEHVEIPPLKELIQLNEALCGVCGSLTPAKTVGIALNTVRLDDATAKAEIKKLEDETGLPVDDVVRYGAEKIADAVTDA